MRGARASLFLATALAAWVSPAAAQQLLAPGDRLALPMPRVDWPADGTPPAFDPGFAERGRPIDCGRDLPCRVRLRGVLGKNGGIALEGTAFTW